MMGAYPDGDVALASLAQMNEISRRAEVAGMTFTTTTMNAPSASGSSSSSAAVGGSSSTSTSSSSSSSSSAPVRPPSSASRIMAAAAGLLPGGSETPVRPMSRQDALARIEELSRARPSSAQGGSGGGSGNGAGQVSGSGPAQSQQDQQQQQQQDTSGGAYDADSSSFLLPGGDDGMRYGVPLNSGNLSHEGLQVYTVGHLMPRSSLDDTNGNWAFDPSTLNAMVMPTPQGMGGDPEQEGENEPQRPFAPAVADAVSDAAAAQRFAAEEGRPPSAQTLRVRRSTYVPGWAVPPRVLLVDDDAVSRRLSSKFLQVFGCTIDVAVDGVGAVNKMNLEKYDLVLMVRPASFHLLEYPISYF